KLAISADGRWLAAPSWDNNVFVLDLSTGQGKWSLRYRDSSRRIAVSSDGNKLASQHDRKIVLWDLNSGVLDKVFTIDDAVDAIALSPDGKILAAAGSM